jgi:hypothetical protein
LQVLTPGHFLVGQSLLALPEPQLHIENHQVTRKWKHIQYLKQQFWRKWSKNYLNQLQQRPKWQQIETNVKCDQIVVIKEDNLPPSSWLLGRVIKVYEGTDSLVRVADIKTKNSILTRPIHKLCVIPIDT